MSAFYVRLLWEAKLERSYFPSSVDPRLMELRAGVNLRLMEIGR